METEDVQDRICRHMEAIVELKARGFSSLGNFRFSKNGLIYDLSAADLGEIETIEREGLFVGVNQ
jgi:hypothetical protein